MGDKPWNPAMLLLHGDPGVIARLQDTVGAPVRFVHTVRNPFDIVATMHRRSGLSLLDRTRWFFNFCEAAAALEDRLGDELFMHVHLDELLAEPERTIGEIVRHVGLPADPDHASACKEILFSESRRTRYHVGWDEELVTDILDRAKRYRLLDRYREEEYSDLWSEGSMPPTARPAP
jgi:hypothetical protein